MAILENREAKKNKSRVYQFSRILAVSMVIALFFSFSGVMADELEEARDRREQAEQEREEREAELEEQRTREESLEAELAELDQELAGLQNELDDLNREIRTTESNIRTTERELRQAESQLEYHEDLLMKRMRVIHERGAVHYLEVLFDSTSFADFLSRLYNLQVIAENDMQLIEEVEAERQAIADKKAELEREKRDLEGMQRQLVSKKDEVDRTKANRSEVLSDLQTEIERTEQAIKEVEEEAAQLEDEIQSIIRERERQQRDDGDRPEGALLWPVESPNYVTSPFGYRTHPVTGQRGSFHGGLDIGTYGQPNRILAAESGEIVFTRHSGGYGKHIMIDHGGGMQTLYAHLRTMSVSPGQQVSRGDTIGRAGTTGSSTGVHLHFEVWINGQRQDPMNYL